METVLTSEGCLYVVATPLGNLGDISARAIEVLTHVDLVLAEDTRHTGALLTHLGLKKRMLSLHAHNESDRTEQLLARLLAGSSVALVSDAGTPLISDPGFPLVREARHRGVTVTPIPGPSAVTAALSVAGIPCDRFAFEGFLPAKPAARKNRLQALSQEQRTLVFYESPHRIEQTVSDLAEIFGPQREAVLLRELTKQFEQVHAEPLGQLTQWLAQDRNRRRGEFVIVVAGAPRSQTSGAPAERVLAILLEYLSVKDAAAAAARITGVSRKTLYQLALGMKEQ